MNERELVCHKCHKKADFKQGCADEDVETGWVDWSFAQIPDLNTIRLYLCGDCQVGYDKRLKEIRDLADDLINSVHMSFLNLPTGARQILGFNVFKEKNEDN